MTTVAIATSAVDSVFDLTRSSTSPAWDQTATGDSVAAIKEIIATIANISQITSTIAAAVEEQGAATKEIARNVSQAAESLGLSRSALYRRLKRHGL